MAALNIDEIIIKFYISELENKVGVIFISDNKFVTNEIPITAKKLKSKI